MKITEYVITDFDFSKVIDLTKNLTEYKFNNVKRPEKNEFVVKIVDSCQNYIELMQ